MGGKIATEKKPQELIFTSNRSTIGSFYLTHFYNDNNDNNLSKLMLKLQLKKKPQELIFTSIHID